MGRYLADLIDTGLPEIQQYDPEEERDKHLQRLANQAAVGFLAEEIPRRLGKDATPLQLARDAQFSKRFGYGAEDMLRAWGVHQKVIDEKILEALEDPQNKRKAAQVDWYEEILSVIAYLRAEMRFNATHGARHRKDKQANKIVLRLENEINTTAQRYAKVFGNPITPKEIVDYENKR